MKKLNAYLTSLEARRKVQVADRKARLAALSFTRRLSLRLVLPLGIAIAIIGYYTKTIHSSFLVALMALLVLPVLIEKPPRMMRRLFVSFLISPPVLFSLGLIISSFTMDIDYAAARRDQAIIQASTSSVARDSAEFLEHFEAGNVVVSGQLKADPFLQLGSNDPFGYRMMTFAYGLIHLFAPSDIDASPILPLAEMSYADRTIVLFDREIAARHARDLRDKLEAKYGLPIDQISAEDQAREMPDYRGISLLVCIVKNNGDTLLATGLPSAYLTDLGKIPEAGPLLDICKRAALDEIPADPTKGIMV